MMKTNHAVFLRLIGSLFALVLLAAPSLGVANVIITSVDVMVGGAEYCSNNLVCPNMIWALPAAVSSGTGLVTAQTLILTQEGTPIRGGEDFDTSDRGGLPALVACSTVGGTPCAVQIRINGVLVVNDLATVNTDNLAARNNEPFSNTALDDLFQEDRSWLLAFTGSGYTLELGYADNIHGGNCASGVGCFPQANWSTGNLADSAATFFLPYPITTSCWKATNGSRRPITKAAPQRWRNTWSASAPIGLNCAMRKANKRFDSKR